MTRQDLEDLLTEAIQDSMDIDWNCSTGAKACLRALEKEGLWKESPKDELARLEAENDAAPGWGAAVGARLERIKHLRAERLEPCPFCTGEYVGVIQNEKSPRLYWIGCSQCGARQSEWPERADAIRAWNQRPALAQPPTDEPVAWQSAAKFKFGERVTKNKGSSWTGRIVGFYETGLTPIGYCIESENEPGSVQIYPETALKAARQQEADNGR